MKKCFMKMAVFALASALAIAGCATSGDPASPGDAFGFRAENVPEGILLSFENIPAGTTWMFVHFQNMAEVGNSHLSTFTRISGTELDVVKQTGMITCPFVRDGNTYFIVVNTGNEDGLLDQESWGTAYAEITANNSVIYVVNDVTLELNDAATTATVSMEPVFSTAVQFASPRYSYQAVVIIERGRQSASYGGKTEELAWAWDFDAHAEALRTEHDFDMRGLGALPAHVVFSANLIHENLEWQVGVAVSEEFAVYF